MRSLRLGERFGAVPMQPTGIVWFHAVSAGEANAGQDIDHHRQFPRASGDPVEAPGGEDA